MRRAVALVVLLAAGCSLPLPGGVRTPSKVAGQDQSAELQVLPQGPTPGQGASAAVAGFIAAQASPLGDYAIARQYLTGRAASDWSPGTSVRVFRPDTEKVELLNDRPSVPNEGNVQVAMTTIATVDSAGHYEPGIRASGDIYHVTKTLVGWRISSLPDGVGLQLSQTDLLRTFAIRNVFYLAPQQHPSDPRHLVPDRVLLPAGTDLAKALVQRLFTEPSKALAGSVADKPSPSLSAESVRTTDGVVTVTLTDEAAVYEPQELRDLYAQLVWTLRQDPRFTGLRLRTAGQVLRLEGQPEVEPATAFGSYDPGGLSADSPYYFLAAGRLRSSAALATSLLTQSVVQAVAVSPRGERVAVLRRRGGRDEVVVGSVRGSSAALVLRASGLSSPTWGSGEIGLWMVQGRSRVVRLDPAGGGLRTVALTHAPAGPVSSLAVARDGVRVAVVIGGRVLVGRIAWNGDAAAVVGLEGLDTSPGVQQVAWSTPTEVVVLIRGTTGARVVQRLAIDGSVRAATLPLGLLSPTSITALGPTVLVASGAPSQVYALGQPAPLQRGALPVFPG